MKTVNFSERWIGYFAADRILGGILGVPEDVGNRVTRVVSAAIWNAVANPLLTGIEAPLTMLLDHNR